MAKFLILVHSDHYANQSSRSALHLAQAIIRSGHQLSAIFFYQNAVLHGSPNADIPSDELDTRQGFIQLKQDHQIPLLLCVTAAEKRGIATDYHQDFTMTGLAEMASISSEVDRIIQFK